MYGVLFVLHTIYEDLSTLQHIPRVHATAVYFDLFLMMQDKRALPTELIVMTVESLIDSIHDDLMQKSQGMADIGYTWATTTYPCWLAIRGFKWVFPGLHGIAEDYITRRHDAAMKMWKKTGHVRHRCSGCIFNELRYALSEKCSDDFRRVLLREEVGVWIAKPE